MKLTNTVTNITKNNKGFSLLEVLVGVSIIGIISAIAVPTFQDYRETASLTASNSSLRNIVKAFNLCVATQAGLVDCISKELLKIDCVDCDVNADSTTNPTTVCGQVVTNVGSNIFQACWDSVDKTFNYGGSFKICKGTWTPTGGTAVPNSSFSPIKKCDKDSVCSGHTQSGGAWSATTCVAGGNSVGICSSGTCN